MHVEFGGAFRAGFGQGRAAKEQVGTPIGQGQPYDPAGAVWMAGRGDHHGVGELRA